MMIAVYGTLKKNYGNYEALIEPYLKNGKIKFIGSGKTKEKYKMYASGIPFVVQNEHLSNIAVEVYDIKNKKILVDIDALEGHPQWYQRRKVPIILDNGKEVQAWLYFYRPLEEKIESKKSAHVVTSGNYDDYKEFRW